MKGPCHVALAETPTAENNPGRGIAFILMGMICISANDMLIKMLSGDYPLHQMVFVRSAIGIAFSLIFVQLEGGFAILKTDRPGLHALRGLLIVVANMAFFTALAVLPLPDATALFFVAPLFITLLSVPLLGEKVGTRRLSAVVIGFIGVLIMLRPGSAVARDVANWAILLLPMVAALAYAMMQILTRRLGITTKASAMAVYIQGTFLVVSGGFWLAAGDGRYAVGLDDESLIFLLRAWQWPAEDDQWLFLALGINSAAIGYTMSRAYKSADAAVIAPFEYVALPLAIFWGWMIWADLPSTDTAAGIVLIMGAGIYVFVRERKRESPVSGRRSWKRW